MLAQVDMFQTAATKDRERAQLVKAWHGTIRHGQWLHKHRPGVNTGPGSGFSRCANSLLDELGGMAGVW
jgi:hypothetical protein